MKPVTNNNPAEATTGRNTENRPQSFEFPELANYFTDDAVSRHVKAEEEPVQAEASTPITEPDTRQYETNWRNHYAGNIGFLIAMQERTPNLPCKAIIIPADAVEQYHMEILISEQNRQNEMIAFDVSKIHNSYPKSKEHEIRKLMYKDHIKRAVERSKVIENTGIIVYGVTAFLMSRAKVQTIAGYKVSSIYPTINEQHEEEPLNINDSKIEALFEEYTAIAFDHTMQENIKALEANGMQDVVKQMHRQLYKTELEQCTMQEANSNPAYKALEYFGNSLEPYRNKYVSFLQSKIDSYPKNERQDLQAIITKDTERVIDLLSNVIADYYKEPKTDVNGQTEESGKGSAEIGATLGILLEEKYISHIKAGELRSRFVITFPQCNKINWKGVQKYYDESPAAKKKQETMHHYVHKALM